MRDHAYNQPAGTTYARTLRETFSSSLRQTDTTARIPDPISLENLSTADTDEAEAVDIMANIEQQAIEALRADSQLIEKIDSSEGVAWGKIKGFFLEQLPEHLDNHDDLAHQLVPKAMNNIYGPQNRYWESYKHPQRNTSYVRKKN